MLCLIAVVIGSMYLGYATATEAAAFGVIGALVAGGAAGLAELGHLHRKPDGCDPHQRDDRADPGGRAFLSLPWASPACRAVWPI